MYRIKTYNQIATAGLGRFPRERYQVGPDVAPNLNSLPSKFPTFCSIGS